MVHHWTPGPPPVARSITYSAESQFRAATGQPAFEPASFTHGGRSSSAVTGSDPRGRGDSTPAEPSHRQEPSVTPGGGRSFSFATSSDFGARSRVYTAPSRRQERPPADPRGGRGLGNITSSGIGARPGGYAAPTEASRRQAQPPTDPRGGPAPSHSAGRPAWRH